MVRRSGSRLGSKARNFRGCLQGNYDVPEGCRGQAPYDDRSEASSHRCCQAADDDRSQVSGYSRIQATSNDRPKDEARRLEALNREDAQAATRHRDVGRRVRRDRADRAHGLTPTADR